MQLQVNDLHASYSANTPILKGVNMTADPGQVTIIVGPNGCGKSTLLRCIARLHRPERGTVMLDSENVWKIKPRQAAHRLSLLPQSPMAPEGMTVANLVQFGRHPHQGLFQQWSDQDQQAVTEALELTHLADLAHRRLDQLSGGQRQRCWLAMTLAQQTPLMLLDEPTSMLDLGHQVEVLNLVRKIASAGDRAFVIVLHDLIAAAQYADQLVTMRDGEIVCSGAPKEILTPELIRELYDVDVRILTSPDNQTPIIVAKQEQLV
ncbi:MAG TPA: Fe(3+)-dicitrate ABC transporter ATP-binding protein [Phycisphaerales bacterium]|nr:Fe(3+)-dicitrate ABC transporter ATP-binding protein [Phycisphaerales bacterium]HCD34064.1 Fe(3+)-dicitrate ABC transporter ATP-binding protein [Phycisphaerales bacterium]|tara:strand:+ start:236 stop:1024 length:789 start_codon:yes stop_codon:yes gene_type:complete